MNKVKDINHIPAMKLNLKKFGNAVVRAGILGDAQLAMIATINEFGKVINPVKGRYLAIPLYPSLKGKSPRDFTNTKLVFPFIKDSTGKNLFVLVKSVTIPERSFLRSTFDDKKVKNNIRKIAEKIFDPKESAENLLEKIGLRMVLEIQKKIRSNIDPPNSPLTTFLKGGKEKTLIAGGKLSQGITHQVIK